MTYDTTPPHKRNFGPPKKKSLQKIDPPLGFFFFFMAIVILSASVERFSVSCIQDFFCFVIARYRLSTNKYAIKKMP